MTKPERRRFANKKLGNKWYSNLNYLIFLKKAGRNAREPRVADSNFPR